MYKFGDCFYSKSVMYLHHIKSIKSNIIFLKVKTKDYTEKAIS